MLKMSTEPPLAAGVWPGCQTVKAAGRWEFRGLDGAGRPTSSNLCRSTIFIIPTTSARRFLSNWWPEWNKIPDLGLVLIVGDLVDDGEATGQCNTMAATF